MEFLPTLGASSQSHINTTCCLHYYRAFRLCHNFELCHQEIDKLKIIFENKGYPKSFVDFCVKKYLDKVFTKKEVVFKVSKKELTCVLPFTGK